MDFIRLTRRSSAHKLENLPVQKILPGHEYIFTDLRGRIEEIVRHHVSRQEEILQGLLQGTRTAYEISSKLTWNIPDFDWNKLPLFQKRIAVTETMAHLEYMRWEGKVERIIDDEIVRFVPK